MLKKVQILQKRENRINQINIRLKDVDSAVPLASSIEKRFGYRTESWQETFANVFEMFMVENIIMYSTVGAIMLVAGFGIFNIISTSVNDKRKDIAILKSMGFSEKDILMIFVFQGILIGIVGTIIGWILGAGLIEYFASFTLDFGEDFEMPVAFDGLPMNRSVWLYIISGLMATLSSTLSAYIPARKAAELHPVEIIRGAA
jgi:lipoprotein-releasing system permease protein